MFLMTIQEALVTNHQYVHRLHIDIKTGEVKYDPPLEVDEACKLLTALYEISCTLETPPYPMALPVHPGYRDWDWPMEAVRKYRDSFGLSVPNLPSPRSMNQIVTTPSSEPNE